MTDKIPEGPWTVFDGTNEIMGSGYLRILGPNQERICDVFPFAGKGGLGIEKARAVAQFIAASRTK